MFLNCNVCTTKLIQYNNNSTKFCIAYNCPYKQIKTFKIQIYLYKSCKLKC